MGQFSSFKTSTKIKRVSRLHNASSPHRFIASLFDFSVVLLGGVIIMIPFIIVFVGSLISPSTSKTVSLAIVGFLTGGIIALFDIAYRVAVPYFWHGMTLGLRFFGMRMLREDGSEVTLKELLIRAFSAIFLAFSTLGIYYIVEVISFFLSPSHRNFCDTISKTIVIDDDVE